ncbi:EmrB/QacA subfamily drug resistance transporter [Murinocardiopsis flavida]|uniref:EmrB/QacA subfamily drug resistance transporter n=1 Tax=Murinocardiopsis flavida TaxID=645275 RepID=A0A2P8DE36_9ACTN|nr:MDR family MFS transporter [Murinocardiopsis flavida]PSK95449.1 EmrB/QacA subfamily drug resistance transporter [Murinocardiopsis flavida]
MPSSTAADRRARRPRGVGAILPGVLLAMLLAALDQTIMAPALPTIAGELGGLGLLSTVVTAYLVAATVAMPLYGKLGDAFGRKRVMQAAILVFLLGAALCAQADTMTELVVFRAVQGAGGGGLMIGAQAIIGEVVSPRERGRYLGLIGGAYILAAVAGPLLGGVLIDHLSWRWIFYLYLPLGVLAFAVLTATLRLPAPPERRPVDYGGALALGATVVCLVLLTSGAGTAGPWPPWATPALVAALVLSGAGWLCTARFARDPVLPLGLFRDPAFAIPGAIGFLIGFAMFTALSYLPAFFQIAMGTSATGSGGLLIALMVGILSTTALSGWLITRTGRYKPFPVIGTATAAVGMALLATLDARSSPAAAAAIMLLLGAGIGLVMQVTMLAVQNSVAHRDLGTATSTVTFLRQIGSSVGVAVMGALITDRFAERVPATVIDRLGGDLDRLTPGFVRTLPAGLRTSVGDAFGAALPPVFGYAVPLLALAFLLAVLLPARPLRTEAHVDIAAPEPEHAPDPATTRDA